MVNSKLSPYAPEWRVPPNRATSNTTTETRIQTLNPNAPEWVLADNRGTEQERCLFVTFSRWLPPLNEAELTRFFNLMYGDRCVQSVAIFNDGPNPPQSAKVVFQTRTIPMRILGDIDEVSLSVNGTTIRCKRYKPKKQHSQNQNGSNMAME